MMWNPTSQVFLDNGAAVTLFNYVAGGQHYLYVTNTEYDGCADLRTRFAAGITDLKKVPGLTTVTWAGIPLVRSGQSLKSLAEGLIPTETTIKIRVDDPYQVAEGTGANSGHPAYMFSFTNVEATQLEQASIPAALRSINVVPNPYYGYSPYETSQFSTTVKLPTCRPIVP